MEASVLDNNSTLSKIDSITKTIRALMQKEELAANKKTHSIPSIKMVSRLRHTIILLSPVTHPLSRSDQLAGILLRLKERSPKRIPISNSRWWSNIEMTTSGTMRTSASRIMSMNKTQNLLTSFHWKTPLAVEILLKKMGPRSERFVRVRILTKTRFIQTLDSSKLNNSKTIRLCPLMRRMIWIWAKADNTPPKIMANHN